MGETSNFLGHVVGASALLIGIYYLANGRFPWQQPQYLRISAREAQRKRQLLTRARKFRRASPKKLPENSARSRAVASTYAPWRRIGTPYGSIERPEGTFG